MKYSKFIFAAVLFAMLFSCAKEAQDKSQTPTSEGITEIFAGFADEQTKTVLGEDGVSVLWSPNDEINVFYNGDGLKFTSVNKTPKDKTIFLAYQTLLFNSTESASPEEEIWIWGVYPFDSSNSSDGESVSVSVPTVQNAVAGSFGKDSFAAIGRSKDLNMSFYNVCGGIRFTVGQSGINKISVRGNDGEVLAGRVKVFFNADGLPEVEAVESAAAEVELTASDKNGFEPGKWYYISILPSKLDKGLEFTFFKGNTAGKKTFSNSREIKRSIFGSISDIDNDVEFVSSKKDIVLDETMVECNAPMEFISFGQGSTETGDHCYGLDGSPDWFMPLEFAMATAREKYLTKPEYMFDGDEATCYHTNLDWGVPYTSWGCRDEEINYGQHYIQINFDSPLSNLGISVVACTDEAVKHVFGDDAALIVKYTTDGEAFTVSGQYPWSYTARIEDKINVGEDNAEYAQDIIAIRFQTNVADNWTHTETAFGIAELAVTAN